MRLITLIAGLLLLSGCGFTPVYGTQANQGNTSVSSELSQIYIANIPDRIGQMLRNNLIDRFYRDSRPPSAGYTLEINDLREQNIGLDITKTSDSTRAQMRLDGTLVLKKNGSTEILLTRNIRAITSYNILGSEFATRVTQNDARENAIASFAEQIEIQLGLYFKRAE